MLTHLNSLKNANNIEFVHGKGKRKSSLQKYIEVLHEYIEKQSKYNEYNLILMVGIAFLRQIMMLHL